MNDLDGRSKKTVSIANIIIVEDESIVAMEIKNMLEGLRYSVLDVVTSGEKAVEKVGKKQPDLVLMDIRLKGDIDGVEAARQIREKFDIPIIYLTAYADEETLKRAKITEPYGYILKPFEERELQCNIEMALYKHKIERKIKENEKHLRNIINSTSEVIISFDGNNRVSTWNKTAEYITGYKKREVINKSVKKLDVFDNSKELSEILWNIKHGKKPSKDRFILRTKNDVKKIIQVSNPTIIKDDDNNNSGIVLVGRDITYEHEKHGKLLKGNSYYVPDKDNESMIHLLINLARLNYKCLFITRSDSETIKSMIPLKEIQIALLKDKSMDHKTISNLKELTNEIEKFCKSHTNAVIMLDRVDYLITLFSYEKFIEELYKINDIISENKSLFLLHLNPSILEKKQLAIIEDELQFLPNQHIQDIIISDELFDLLEFIHVSTANNIMVSLKKIKSELTLTYPTIAKRLKLLENKDLVSLKLHGRLKTVHISEKGKRMINNRQIA